MGRIINWVWHASDKLAADTLWAISSEIVKMAFTLFSFLMLQRVLSPAEYGGYISAYAIAAPLGALVFSGPALAALTALLRDKRPASETLNAYLSVALLAAVGSFLIGVGLSLLVVSGISLWETVFIFAGELIAVTVVYIYSSVVQAGFGFAVMKRMRLGLVAVRALIMVPLVALDLRLAERYSFIESIPVGVERFESLTVLNLAVGQCLGYGAYSLWLLKKDGPRRGLNYRRQRNTREACKLDPTK